MIRSVLQVARPLPYVRVRAMTTTACHVKPNLFGYVSDMTGDPTQLIARSKETLRLLGGCDDYVRLHLPSTFTNLELTTSLPRTAVIEVHNPSSRNALSGKMMAEFADVVTTLEDQSVYQKLCAVIVRGNGGWFCAGADLKVAKQELSSRNAGTAMSALMADTLNRFRRLPLISVAVVEGGAFGGGAELSTSCDFRLMADNAVIQFVQARMGVTPGWGGGARLHKIVGRQHALRALCSAEKITPKTATAMGLVDRVIPSDNVEQACIDFLRPFDESIPGMPIKYSVPDLILTCY